MTLRGKLAGKVAVVTGGAGTLGAAIARRFLDEGADGVVIADLDPESVAAAIDAFGDDRVEGVVGDVRDPASTDSIVGAAVGRFGRLDVMVNNAGVLSGNGRVHNQTLDEWRRVLDVNLLGVVNGTVSALRVMRPRRSGVIVNTASVAGLTVWTHSAPYGVSKAAVIQLTKTTALEYADEGIRANCVCPGSFPSSMLDQIPRPAIEPITARHPLGMGDVDSLAAAFVYLASDDARWTTGTALVVDGGYSLP